MQTKLEYSEKDFWQNITREIKLTRGNQPITHRMKIATMQFVGMQRTGELRHKYKTPKNLTIITAHNYEQESLFEKNLEFLNMDYLIFKLPPTYKWVSITKLKLVLDYLRSGICKTEYVLFCDANDVIIRDDPQKIVDVIEDKKCNMLFNSTMFKGGMLCMPEVFEWLKTVAVKKGRYLNAGVFVGKTELVREVLEEASKYFTTDSITAAEYSVLGRGIRDTRLCEELENWPVGSTDQDILRYLHPQFYPDMDIDYRNELAYRN
jgi:hypothetical protein